MGEILQVLFIIFSTQDKPRFFPLVPIQLTYKHLAISYLVIEFIFFNLQETLSGDLLPSMSQLSPMEEFFCHASVGETVSNLFLLHNDNYIDQKNNFSDLEPRPNCREI